MGSNLVGSPLRLMMPRKAHLSGRNWKPSRLSCPGGFVELHGPGHQHRLGRRAGYHDGKGLCSLVVLRLWISLHAR